MFHHGLDWLVAEARHYGLRLILTLTNGISAAFGGAWQYGQWLAPGTATAGDFYGVNSYRAAFMDYVAALATRCVRSADRRVP